MNHNRTAAGHLAAFVTILIWGTTFISTKVLLRTFSPVEILFIRFVMGYLALWLACPRSLRLTSARQEGLYAAAGFCGVTMYYLLENIALTYTLASNVGVIISIAPFFTAILGWMFLGGERPRFRFFAGFLLAMAGISLISFGNEAALSLQEIYWPWLPQSYGPCIPPSQKKSAHWATALSRVPEGPFFTEFYLWCRL